MYFFQGMNIIDYIVKRIDERLKIMQTSRLLFINTISLEELKRNKSAIIKLFIEIEDDMKQTSQALSSLLLQNKDLSEEKENYDKTIRRHEQKAINCEKLLIDANSKNKELHNENQVLSLKLRDIEKFTKQISYLEDKLDQKDELIIKLDNDKKELTGKLENFREEMIKYKEEKDQPVKSIEMVDDNENYDSEMSNDFNFKNIDKKLNFSNYFQERQQKKKLINQVIKQHLNNDEEINENYENEKLDTILEKSIRNEQDDNNDYLIEKREKLILNINNEVDSLSYLEDTLGIDFLSKLLNQNVQLSYLDKVENALKNYKDKMKHKNKN